MALHRLWISSVIACLAHLAAATSPHMGTMDYIAKRYYTARDDEHGKDADKHLLHMFRAEGSSQETRYTAWLGESPRMHLGSYVVEECGFTRGTFAYFCTFDFNGYVLKFDSITKANSFVANQATTVGGLRLMESLSLGSHGGHFLSAATHGGQFGFFATAAAPATIITVNLDATPLTAVSNLTLPEDYGGIFAMSVVSESNTGDKTLLAILGKPPVRLALLNVNSAGVVEAKYVHEVASDDEAACPSSAFVDRGSETALIATRGGCVHRVSYAGGTLQPPSGWAKACSSSASNFRRMAVAKNGQVAVIGSFFPMRQLLQLDLFTGEFTDAMPLPNRDVAFVTNIMSTNNNDVYVVGNSLKGMPVVMQLNLSSSPKLSSQWGIVAAGQCDEYSWAEDKKKHYSGGESGNSIRHWPIRYYGCTWVPKGRYATGAVLSPEGRLYIAAKRHRCTVCTEQEKEFTGTGGFCAEEFEDYRAPASECGQHVHNKRPFVRERMLTVAQIQRESNSLAGGENFTLIEFQLGAIPEIGEMHAPVIKSHATRSWSSWRMVLAPILFALGNTNLGPMRFAVRNMDVLAAGALMALMISVPGAEALDQQAKAFHQHENGCNCLLGCTILGEDSNDCTDDNAKNTEVWERRLAKVGNDNRATCDLMKCIAYCAGPEQHTTELMGRRDELLCASIAKQIGCQMDCSKAYGSVSWNDWLLPMVLMFTAVSQLI